MCVCVCVLARACLPACLPVCVCVCVCVCVWLASMVNLMKCSFHAILLSLIGHRFSALQFLFCWLSSKPTSHYAGYLSFSGTSYTCCRFPTILHKGDNLCTFLFASLNFKPLLQRGSHLLNCIYFKRTTKALIRLCECAL